jgi:hypothetical protein
MALFTVVLEFDGGTFIAQVRAASVKKAVAKYSTALLSNDTIGKVPTRRRLAKSLSKEELVPVETVTNVWCCSASAGNKFALLNFIRTAG